MMRSKILPLKDSVISYTPNFDHFLSVLENQHDVAFPWILENYIELIIRKDRQNPPVFEFLDYNKIWWTCPFVHVSRIDREAFSLFGNLCITIKKLIDKNYYVFFLVDTYYVKGYVTYQKEHLMHDIFIYGYEDGSFYTCDYFDFSKKSTRKIAANDIENGYKNVSKPNDYGRGVVLFHNEEINDNIVLYQYKESLNGLLDVEKKGYPMDRNLVKVKLGRFLESPPYINSVTPTWFDYRLGYTAGFKVFYVLQDAFKSNIPVTPKDLHLVCCHVQLMIKRLDYLIEKEPDDMWVPLREHFKEDLNIATIIKSMLIKESLKNSSGKNEIYVSYLDKFMVSYKENLTAFHSYL